MRTARTGSEMQIIVYPRIAERHPDLSEEDVRFAWQHANISALRTESSNFPEMLSLGHDSQGRLLEMVGAMTFDGWLIYHAMTPPSKKTLLELRRAQRKS